MTVINPFMLMLIEGHHADVWCLALNNGGDFIVSGSHGDLYVIGIVRKKPFFIEKTVCTQGRTPGRARMALVGKKTQETLTRIDLIIEPLDIAKKNWIVLLNMRYSNFPLSSNHSTS
ncbi:hypothetical protein Patl1_12140 [Pistacia atlantica]|uniref:Uncharacterized protein n=1 Tax=Pistacia atlantica TaxID=434234 RepID=A0ACC1A289_9ROSI|nr:hypothetical protein Patl1_12140 [Pistacia atlantica]